MVKIVKHRIPSWRKAYFSGLPFSRIMLPLFSLLQSLPIVSLLQGQEQRFRAKRHLLTVACSAALLTLLGSCATRPVAETNQDDPLAHSLLWSITGNGLSDTSWLYGTIHLISQEDFFVRPEVEAAMASCDQVAFEIKLNDLSMMMTMMRLLKLPGDSTLADVVSADRYQRLTAFVEDSLGLSMASYDRQKPMALMQVLVQQMVPGTPASYELDFMQRALSAEQSIEGLETVEDQMAVFDGIPMDEQVDWILQMAENRDSMQALYGDLVAAYRAEDLTALQQLIMEDSPEMAEYNDELLTNRNRNWIPRIGALAAESPVFIAVGAGHLPGETGVIRLLEEAGYILQAIPPSADRP